VGENTPGTRRRRSPAVAVHGDQAGRWTASGYGRIGRCGSYDPRCSRLRGSEDVTDVCRPPPARMRADRPNADRSRPPDRGQRIASNCDRGADRRRVPRRKTGTCPRRVGARSQRHLLLPPVVVAAARPEAATRAVAAAASWALFGCGPENQHRHRRRDGSAGAPGTGRQPAINVALRR